jgi:hypothetical protein
MSSRPPSVIVSAFILCGSVSNDDLNADSNQCSFIAGIQRHCLDSLIFVFKVSPLSPKCGSRSISVYERVIFMLVGLCTVPVILKLDPRLVASRLAITLDDHTVETGVTKITTDHISKVFIYFSFRAVSVLCLMIPNSRVKILCLECEMENSKLSTNIYSSL